MERIKKHWAWKQGSDCLSSWLPPVKVIAENKNILRRNTLLKYVTEIQVTIIDYILGIKEVLLYCPLKKSYH